MLTAISCGPTAPMSSPTGQARRSNSSGVASLLPQELLPDDAHFAPAADQPEKREGQTNPLGQRQRIVLMAARDDQAEGPGRRTQFQQFVPGADPQLDRRREKFPVGQFRPVVENGDGEIQLPRERRPTACATCPEPAIHNSTGGATVS